MNTFSETQQFRQLWVWILIGFVALVMIGALTVANAWNHPISLFTILTLVLISLLLYVWRLETRLDVEGIHYRVFPLVPWRTIQWTAIRSASIQKYSFVGYGIRWGSEGWVYNVAGDKGLRVVFPDKHQITIGTQQPKEMQAFLANYPTLIAT